ncbi:MAG: hypothetical protein SFY70_04915 [Bacteroidia bacterium]|nr:hypothetical protein [Bacteroidia bacterium]
MEKQNIVLTYKDGAVYGRDGEAYTGELTPFIKEIVEKLKSISETGDKWSVFIQMAQIIGLSINSNRILSDKSKSTKSLRGEEPPITQGRDIYMALYSSAGGATANHIPIGYDLESVLVHEIAHVLMNRIGAGIEGYFVDPQNGRKSSNDEYGAVYFENLFRMEKGLTMREYYSYDAMSRKGFNNVSLNELERISPNWKLNFRNRILTDTLYNAYTGITSRFASYFFP